jgi:hypothetical protein
MNRRGFLAGVLATAALRWVPLCAKDLVDPIREDRTGYVSLAFAKEDRLGVLAPGKDDLFIAWTRI